MTTQSPIDLTLPLQLRNEENERKIFIVPQDGKEKARNLKIRESSSAACRFDDAALVYLNFQIHDIGDPRPLGVY